MNVTLEGGEPFYHPDIEILINSIVENRMRFSILSNGTLVDDNLASFLASTGRCNGVQVSIDGSSPASHDLCRGKGNFERAIEGISHLQKHTVPLTVRVTIHKGNIDDLDNIAKLLLEDLGINGFSTNSASYMGLCRKNTDIVQLDIDEQARAMESLLRLEKKYNGRITSTAGPHSNAERWMRMERARLEKIKDLPGGGFLTGCNGVIDNIAVRPDGVIVPCLQMSHIELGRINKDDLIQVWQNHPELKKLRERNQIPLTNFKFCQGCEYIPYCTGNCPALAYTLTGDVYKPSPDACLKRYLELGGKLPGPAL
jgi:SynChlorMet cassette radical SAM/SPASM protein ScmE